MKPKGREYWTGFNTALYEVGEIILAETKEVVTHETFRALKRIVAKIEAMPDDDVDHDAVLVQSEHK